MKCHRRWVLVNVNMYLKLAELFLSNFFIASKFFILGLVDEDDSVGLQKCFGEQTLRESLESSPDEWQVDAVNGDVIAGRALTCRLTTTINGDGARDVTDGNSVTVFLNLDLLTNDN